jgi:NADH:ubiquinone oxidoreductase subunit F (NADH-binding)
MDITTLISSLTNCKDLKTKSVGSILWAAISGKLKATTEGGNSVPVLREEVIDLLAKYSAFTHYCTYKASISSACADVIPILQSRVPLMTPVQSKEDDFI